MNNKRPYPLTASVISFPDQLILNSLRPYPLADLGNFLPKSRSNSLRTLHLNEQSVWPYPLTGNFVVKSVVDSDIQVNGGADADPKKQVCGGGGGGGGLRAPVWPKNRKGAWVRATLVAGILSYSFSFVPEDKNVLFITFRVSKKGFSMFLT